MEKLFYNKTKRLEKKLNELKLETTVKIDKTCNLLKRLYNYTECHIYKNVIDDYYILLNCVKEKSKYKKVEEYKYSYYRDTVNYFSGLYLSLSWVEQLLRYCRKDLIEPGYPDLSKAIQTILSYVLLKYAYKSKKYKGINKTIKDIYKYCNSVVSVANTDKINLAIGLWLHRNYLIDMGRQRSKYLLPEYDIVETEFKFDFDLKEIITDLEKISDISLKDLYDSFLHEYNDNTSRFEDNESIILFELSKNPRNKFLAYGFENSEYSHFLNKVLHYKLPDLYSLDLLYYTLELYPVHRLNQSCRDLGFNSAQVQICYNLLNALPTNTVKEILDIDVDKVRIKKQWYINETSYGISQHYFEEQFKIIIFMFLNELIDEAWDKTEKVLKQLYSAVEVREEYVEKTPVF